MSDAAPITAALAAYAAGARTRPLPEKAAERARLHLLDTLSAMISGTRLPAGVAAIAYADTLAGAAACVPGTALMLGAADAALINGMTAHADETDDTHAASLTHPGSVVVPAALAVAEKTGADGVMLLRAIALGYDLCCRMALALGSYDFFGRGFDTHAFGGVFGAAGAAGVLLDLDERRFRFALSYAAQQCAGITTWRRDPDHIEKAFDFAGMPARNGVQAALMVASGMTGVADVLDGTPSFFSAFSAQHPYLAIEALGDRFDVAETSIKKWCVATPAQAPLDALDVIMRDQGLTATAIARIAATIGATGARVVTGNMPNVNAAHLLALLAVDGALTFHSSHDEARMRDPAVLAMRERVTIIPSDTIGLGRDALVEVETHDGKIFRHHALHVRGTPANAMSEAEIVAKASDLLAPILGDRADRLIEQVLRVDSIPNVCELRPLLVG
ncbi:MAG: MmgE/PrpD family protein [Sphingomonas sp.]|uniref:MmgE/PrpD family protein n=1 Tax=Sphingomonas sp. TaxID=28214 RepID=UPI001ACCFCC5|nr:MmgE/PrpD family protein [Sphingomonas sp.]MBN8816817.1 MmgE/PrpD family protein [Sphingomonas sp.]